jgi:hypothetical protein
MQIEFFVELREVRACRVDQELRRHRRQDSVITGGVIAQGVA